MYYKGQKLTHEGELAELVARAKENDSRSQATLCEHLYPKIFKFCFYRVNNVEDVKDLTGDIILKIMKSLKSQKGSFSGWFYRIATNHVIDFYRRQSRRNTVEIFQEPNSNIFQSTENDIENVLIREQLRVMLGKLADEQRIVIILRFIQGYSIKEVSNIMQKSVGAIKSLQFRALRSLKELMKENEK